MTTFGDDFVSAEPNSGASEAIGLSHHSHRPPSSHHHHFPSDGIHSLLRDFSWEPTGVEGLEPSISDNIPGREGRQRWSLGSGRAQLPREPRAARHHHPQDVTEVPSTGIPSGALFLRCSSPPCCQNGKACAYRLLTQAE